MDLEIKNNMLDCIESKKGDYNSGQYKAMVEALMLLDDAKITKAKLDRTKSDFEKFKRLSAQRHQREIDKEHLKFKRVCIFYGNLLANIPMEKD